MGGGATQQRHRIAHSAAVAEVTLPLLARYLPWGGDAVMVARTNAIVVCRMCRQPTHNSSGVVSSEREKKSEVAGLFEPAKNGCLAGARTRCIFNARPRA